MKTSPCRMSPHQLNPKNNSAVNDGQIMVLLTVTIGVRDL